MTRVPDSRERTAIITFLKLYWDIRECERRQMLAAIGNQFATIREMTLPPWASAALLQLARHAVCTAPPESGQLFLDLTVTAIVPLVISAHVRMFFNELKDYLFEFHRLWPDFRVLSLWHIQKECALAGWAFSQFCVDVVVSIVVHLDRRLFGIMAPCFCGWFADLLSLPRFHVAVTVLGIILPQGNQRSDYQAFVKHHASAIIHHCYGAIAVLAQDHWQCDVRARAEEALRVLAQLNPAAVAQAQAQRRKQAELRPQHGRRSWMVIASSVDWEELGRSEEQANEQIAALYDVDVKTRMNSKFMPGPLDAAAKDLYTEALKKSARKTGGMIEASHSTLS
jgi:hypothetical protein